MLYNTPLLETDRLILRRGSIDDYKKVYEYDFTKLRGILGENELVKQDLSLIEGMEEVYPNSYDWIIYLKDNMKPIGNVVADREQKNIKGIELAFNTHPNYWKMGYTFEALIKIMDFLYNNGYENILCGYDEGNIKSKNISLKLGFEPYKVKENAWIKNNIPITTYINILSRDRYNELYKKYNYKN